MKRRILIVTGRYLPGYKDGGPVRSILNLSQWFADELDIRIICLDRDHGDEKPYPDIRYGQYNQVGNVKVWYVESFNNSDIIKLSQEVDLVYVCGPYSDYAIKSMLLKKLRLIKAPMVIASMGSFSPDAFNIKGGKKALFIKLMRLAGMFSNISWSVTSKREEEELKAIVGESAKCIIASDLARKSQYPHKKLKEDKSLDICFVSRISKKKNLIVIPDILKRVSEDIRINIDIYGIAEDKEYLEECLCAFKSLPDRIRWSYKGEADSEKIPELFSHYDVFLFPTLGENYGHVIAESMDSGCVPVISDRTPWLDLGEHDCGYVLSLDSLGDFAEALNALALKDDSEYKIISANCSEYMRVKKETDAAKSGYRIIFGF